MASGIPEIRSGLTHSGRWPDHHCGDSALAGSPPYSPSHLRAMSVRAGYVAFRSPDRLKLGSGGRDQSARCQKYPKVPVTTLAASPIRFPIRRRPP